MGSRGFIPSVGGAVLAAALLLTACSVLPGERTLNRGTQSAAADEQAPAAAGSRPAAATP